MEDSQKISCGVLTVSDRCFANEAVDKSGQSLIETITAGVIKNAEVVWNGLVPDDVDLIQTQIKHCCDDIGVNVLICTGGTGLAESDVTPEAIFPLLERQIPAFSTKMVVDGLRSTPHAILSRSFAGVRKKTLVICLPGSQKGCIEGLGSVASVIPHAVDVILDRKKAVSSIHEPTTSVDSARSKVTVNTSENSRLRCSKFPMVDMTDFPKLLTENVNRLSPITVHSLKSNKYVLAETVFAAEDLPKQPTSMKDGYAIFQYALSDGPAIYEVCGEYKPGGVVPSIEGDFKKPTAVKLSTGSCIPVNTFAVVPVEDTEVYRDNAIILKRVPTQGEDIRLPGSDLKNGSVVLEKNSVIGPAEIGVLASIAQTNIKVYRRPIVAILSTGDELQDAWAPSEDRKIRDCNRPVLIELFKQLGFETVDIGIAQDDPDKLLKALKRGFYVADVLISTGGMSMGERDLIKEVLQTDMDATIHFGRLRMKPGKPTGFATLSINGVKKYWFGLPGNPASAFVMAHLVVLPALRMLSGWTKEVFLRQVLAEVRDEIKKDPERVEYLRGIYSTQDDEGCHLLVPRVATTGKHVQQSSCIRGCSYANCLIEVPSGQGSIAKGTNVLLYLLP